MVITFFVRSHEKAPEKVWVLKNEPGVRLWEALEASLI